MSIKRRIAKLESQQPAPDYRPMTLSEFYGRLPTQEELSLPRVMTLVDFHRFYGRKQSEGLENNSHEQCADEKEVAR